MNVLRHVWLLSLGKMRFLFRMLMSKIKITPKQYRFSHSVIEKPVPSRVITDFRTAENMFKRNHPKENISKFLHQCFEDKMFAYDLIIQACKRYNEHRELTHSILMTFYECFQSDNYHLNGNREKINEVFHVILNQKNYFLAKQAFSAFNMHDEVEHLQAAAEVLVQDKMFTEAAILIAVINAQEQFSLEEVIFPLVCDEEMSIIALYLKRYPQLQLQLVKKLDSLLGDCKNSNISKELACHFNFRRLFKVLTSILRTFKISTEECKNLHFIRSKGALNILIKKKSVMSKESWEEMILNIVGDSAALKKHLVYALARANEQETAVEMAKKFEIPDSQFFIVLEANSNEETPDEILDENETQEDTALDTDHVNAESCADDDYLKFPLKLSDINIVTTEEEFSACISDISQNYEIIGIDCEWKPHFGLSHNRLALVQLAMHDKVFILDMLSLKECLKVHHWDILMDDVFGNPKIIKLGCGIMSDVQMLVDDKQGTKEKTIIFSHILDVAIFYQKLREVYPNEMGFNEDNKAKGLSTLCSIFLGKPLNKEDRICDWERRPLTESQLEYAALDAYSLLKIYDKLKEVSFEKNINFNHMVKVSIILTTSLWRPKRKHKGIKQGNDLSVYPPICIEDCKVSLDPKFENLAKKLREYGADVVLLNTANAVCVGEQLAKSERRPLLCSNFIAKQVRHRISHNLIIELEDKECVSDLIPHIFQRLNIQFKAEGMISRCIACNSQQIMNILHKDLLSLFEQSQRKGFENETQNETDVVSDELQSTISDMLKSGINIKFNTFPIEQMKEIKNGLLCVNCGYVHCYR